MSQLKYIFCHGLSGWGEYDSQYQKMPYWGMRNGDLLEKLRAEGYECHGASVSPTGSAWDRACELYAQLAGARTDYGHAHSLKYNHERYGPDFTGRPLISSFDDDTRIVLLGHSFGGATVRLLSQLMADGDEAERDATHPKDLSDLFKGGMEHRIFAIVTLAAPTNGTTSYDLYQDSSFDVSAVKIPAKYRLLAKMMSMGTSMKRDGRHPDDYANYDMHIDNALALNQKIRTLPDTYYFSAACTSTVWNEDGTAKPDEKITESLYVRSSILMGRYKGKTAKGFVIDESWRENDGLVNTVSARAPLGAPQKQFNKDHIEKGVWNILPDYPYDHMSFQGGLIIRHDPLAFYEELLGIINQL
jgi:triacylglycerol lipase